MSQQDGTPRSPAFPVLGTGVGQSRSDDDQGEGPSPAEEAEPTELSDTAAAGNAATDKPKPTRSGPSFARSTSTMAIGTALSRLTGLIRTIAIIAFVGTGGLADAYNLANTVPNMLVDLVLGGVLSATFVPVFVQRLVKDSDEDALVALSAISSMTVVVIAVASLVFLALTPGFVHLLTIRSATATVAQRAETAAVRKLATDLLFLFVPQLACYGLISLMTALLNAMRRFAAPMFAPIANNLILIAILVEFRVLVGSHPTVDGLLSHQGWLLLLGLGTTFGVVVQACLLVPSLWGTGIKLKWQLRPRHHAVKTIVRLSGWTFGLVIGNELALAVVLAMSFAIHTPGAVSAYTYAYQFFQLPYGIIAVSIMSATTPVLAEHWTTGDLDAFRVRFSTGLRSMLGIIIPSAVGMLILARPFVEVLGRGTSATGQSLSMLSIGIPGFCIFLYAIRAFQAIQDLKSAFWLYALENGINIVLAIALTPALGVRGIGLSISVAYTAAAVVALFVLGQKIGGIRSDIILVPLRRVVVSSLALAIATSLAVNISGSDYELTLFARLVFGVLAGGAAFVLVAGLLARRVYTRSTGRVPSHARSTRWAPRRGRIKD